MCLVQNLSHNFWRIGKNTSNLVFLILIIPDKIYLATNSVEIFFKVPFFTAYPS